jgi:hypothetical protein
MEAPAAARRQNSTRRIKREDRIDPSVPTHPAVVKKSADLVGCKRVLKHSLLKERMKRASERGNIATSERLNVWTSNSGGSWLTITAPPPMFFISVHSKDR